MPLGERWQNPSQSSSRQLLHLSSPTQESPGDGLLHPELAGQNPGRVRDHRGARRPAAPQQAQRGSPGQPPLCYPVPKPLPLTPAPLSQEELPIILKRKKTLQKLISDWNSIKSRYGAGCALLSSSRCPCPFPTFSLCCILSDEPGVASPLPPKRLNQAAKGSGNSAGAGTVPGASSANKLEILKEEEEEVKRKVEQCKVRTSPPLLRGGAERGRCPKPGQEAGGHSSRCVPSQDEYMADLYHFSTKEDSYASYFIRVSRVFASPTHRVGISWGKKKPGGVLAVCPLFGSCWKSKPSTTGSPWGLWTRLWRS